MVTSLNFPQVQRSIFLSITIPTPHLSARSMAGPMSTWLLEMDGHGISTGYVYVKYKCVYIYKYYTHIDISYHII